MSGLLEYSGVATKIRAMRTRLLTREDFENMAEKSSISEVLTYLAGTDTYGDVLALDGNPNNMEKSNIERRLYKALYNDYDKLYRFSGDGPRNYLRLILIKHEVEFIKTCIRNLFINQRKTSVANTTNTNNTTNAKDSTNPTNLNLYREFFERKSKFDVIKIYESESIGELIDNLAKSAYYPVLKLLADNPDTTLFDYESQLDIFLFKTTWNICNEEMSRSYQKILINIYGEQIDLLNLQWVYRARKFYRLNETQTMELLIPIYYKVKKRVLLSLIRAEDDNEFNEILYNLNYTNPITRQIKKGIAGPPGDEERQYIEKIKSINLEKLYDERMEELYFESQKNNPYSVACIANYMFTKEKEIEDIIKLIEFVGYNRGKDFISYKYNKEGIIA